MPPLTEQSIPERYRSAATVPAVMAPAVRRDNPLTRSLAGILGLCFLSFMLLVSLGSLPWALSPVAGETVPRYNAGSPSAGRLPPAWWPPDAAQRERLDAIVPESVPSDQRRERWPTYFLGTDVLGRSVLIRSLAGGGISLAIGLAAAFVSVGIGTMYGLIAGYAGGRLDSLMMRVVDILYGLPYILLVVLLAVAVDAMVEDYAARHGDLDASTRTLLDLGTLLIAIGGVSWLTMARVIRGQVLSLKNQPFIEAARALGLPRRRIFLRHLLPNLMGPVVVYATLTVPQAILQESFLSFLGIGVKPPLPSWGNLAAEGLPELNPYESNWWLLLFPCVLLAGTLLALNFVGEGLREALDPKRARR